MKACSLPSKRSMRASSASASSTGERVRRWMAADRAWTGSSLGSLGMAHMTTLAGDCGGQSAASAPATEGVIAEWSPRRSGGHGDMGALADMAVERRRRAIAAPYGDGARQHEARDPGHGAIGVGIGAVPCDVVELGTVGVT